MLTQETLRFPDSPTNALLSGEPARRRRAVLLEIMNLNSVYGGLRGENYRVSQNIS